MSDLPRQSTPHSTARQVTRGRNATHLDAWPKDAVSKPLRPSSFSSLFFGKQPRFTDTASLIRLIAVHKQKRRPSSHREERPSLLLETWEEMSSQRQNHFCFTVNSTDLSGKLPRTIGIVSRSEVSSILCSIRLAIFVSSPDIGKADAHLCKESIKAVAKNLSVWRQEFWATCISRCSCDQEC